MGRTKKWLIRCAGVATAVLAGVAPTAMQAASPASATANGGRTYYILIGGTCDGGGRVYDQLDFRGGVKLKAVYPATIPGMCGFVPYANSVEMGRAEANRQLINAYNSDRAGRFVVVGYSQGADVAEKVLADVADGRVRVPTGQVKGKIYSSPQQPGTGVFRLAPPGAFLPFFGLRSSGLARTDLNGIRYDRYCITDDGICDTRNLFVAIGGYFAQHPCYGRAVMPSTVADQNYSNGTRWWPRVNCHTPWP